MSKLIVVAGRTLQQSDPSPTTVTFTLTETDVPAARANGDGHAMLIDRLSLACTCSGDFSPTQTYVGSGNAEILARRDRVRCEGKPLLLVGDQVTIACSGTATDKSTAATVAANASVTVTIVDGNQTTILASEA